MGYTPHGNAPSRIARIFIQQGRQIFLVLPNQEKSMEKTKDHPSFEDRFGATPLKETSNGSSHRLSEPASSSQSPSSSDQSTPFPRSEHGDPATVRKHLKKIKTKGTGYAYRIREHVNLGPKFWDTVKGKLIVGATIIKKGGREGVFRDLFGLSDGEKLLKASQCYLSTTAGPIAGTLFTSTQKVGFFSERPIAVETSSGAMIRTPYKVSVPVKNIKLAIGNVEENYIEIVTEDRFEFWFMGFVRYEKALMNLERAISGNV